MIAPGCKRGEDLVVQLGERGIGDEQDDEIRRPDHVEHLAERAVVLREPFGAGLIERRRSGTQPDRDRDVGTGERVAQVQRLGPALRSPADHPDAADAGEGLGQEPEQVTTAGEHSLVGAVQFDVEQSKRVRFHAAVVRSQP